MNKKKLIKNISLIVLLFAMSIVIVFAMNLNSSEAASGTITLADIMATEQTENPLATATNKSNYAQIISRSVDKLLGYKVTESTSTTNRNIEQQAEYAFCIQENDPAGNTTWYITQILDIGGSVSDSTPNIKDLNTATYYKKTSSKESTSSSSASGDIYSKLAIYAYMQNKYKVENYAGYRTRNSLHIYTSSLYVLLPSVMSGVTSSTTTTSSGISQDLLELEGNYANFVNKLQKANGTLFDDGQTTKTKKTTDGKYGPINVKLKDGLSAQYTEVHYTYEDEYNKTHENQIGAIGTFAAGVEVKLTVTYTDGTTENITDSSTAYIVNSSGKKISSLSTFDWKTNFYVVPASGKTIEKIKVSYSYDTYRARYLYLSGTYGSSTYASQGYGVFGGGKYTTSGSYIITADDSAKVTLKKVDSSTKSALTSGKVTFKIYDSSNTCVATLTKKSGDSTTETITLSKGKYTIKEITNNTYGYKRANYNKEVNITADTTIEIENTQELKNLTINKKGESGSLLEKVNFLISLNNGTETKYIRIEDNTGKKVSNISSATISKTGISTGTSNYTIKYVTEENVGDATTFTTDANGKIEIKNLEVWANSSTKYKYTAIEQSNENYGYKGKTNAGKSASTSDISSTNSITVNNTIEVGNLKVTKVDERDSSVTLKGVDFKLSNESGYIQLVDKDGNTQSKITGTANITKTGKAYVDNKVNYYKVVYTTKDKATTFTTDAKGNLAINNLEVYKDKDGNKYNYVIEEIATNNDYYQITEATVKATLTKDKTVEKEIGNKQVYIDLSGYVWVDQLSDDKQPVYNNLYKDTTSDSDDVRLAGVKVRLLNNGNVVKNGDGNECITTTDENGEYTFKKVSVDELSNYYVEFSYDGVEYTSIELNLDKDNGSKAQEDSNSRITLNNKYVNITNSFTNNDKNVIATTKLAGYTITQTGTKIENINLGLRERAQTDMSISSETDVERIDVTVKGYTHTYSYAESESTYNTNITAGVESKFREGVMRSISQTDIAYSKTLAENDDNRLKVYVTYKIAIQNDSNSLAVTADEIVNYLDARYSITDSYLADGTKITWVKSSGYNANSKYSGSDYTTWYTTDLKNKLIDYVGSTDSSNVINIYLKVQVNDETVLGLLNGDATLNSVTEINTYTTYYTSATYEAGETEKYNKNQKVLYASLDVDSTPGTATPGDSNTYEDDTDKLPAVTLTIEEARGLSGTAWEDENVMSNGERLGNGILDNNENKVANVKVELLDADTLEKVKLYTYNTSTGEVETKDAEAITGEDGSYKFIGVIPGNYVTRFTYGDLGNETVTTIGGTAIDVRDYKSTIMTSNTINTAIASGNLKWYLLDDTNRYSDATDDLEQRANTEASIYGETTEKATMFANTSKYDVAIEFTSTNFTMVDEEGNLLDGQTDSNGNLIVGSFTQIYDKLDFGIIQRPIIDLEVKKEVSYIKIILQSGQVLLEGDPRSQDVSISYVKTGLSGIVPVEMDTELLQGATLEVTYAITVTNNSEIDYDYTKDGGNYYKYGTKTASALQIASVTKLVDYLDNNVECAVDDTTNTDWKKITLSDLCASENNVYVANKANYISEDVYNELATGNYIILETAKFANLDRGNSDTVELKVSKLLAETDDITINNYTEILKLGVPRTITGATPGNYVPRTTPVEKDEDTVKVTIAPPTGGTDITTVDYMPIIISSVLGLAIIALGAFTIKKFIIPKNKK
jgi:hypothetical protein